MMRLFIAIPLPGPVRAQLVSLQSGLQSGLRSGRGGTRWVDPENLHLTLRFIGELPGDVAEDLDGELKKVVAPAFEFHLKGLGTFGGGRKLRALWAGAEPVGPLVHLHEKIEAAAGRAGLAPEGRRFTPHVTLARFGKSPPAHLGEYLHAHGGLRTGPVPVPAFTLYRSHLGRGRAYYQPLASYELTG